MRREPQEVSDRIVAALDRIARGVRSARRASAGRLGLTPLQLDLLLAIDAGEPPSPVPGALARELAVSQPTVTDALAALERKGLVERRRDARDRRRAVFALRAAGEEAVAEAARDDRVVREAVAGLAGQEALLAGLLDVIGSLLDAGVIDVARTCTTCRFFRADAAGAVCDLLGAPLAPTGLRVDCAEHEPATAGVPPAPALPSRSAARP